ncbi:Inner membrane protein, KefB/KefC family [uncultured Gammaproteobacteria bacterium]|uniref:monovalent cation:proton antiporter family protein n=1 Tax=Bathymodiolus heckerae thiotrophic gill symbiont TaxID=1052212 RepID=UPI0010B95C0F|nr:monovalent cation:proton antiporter family protein [Bathymodiolus heckerae thiotrophic gill symbiont]CAC9951385.1 Inner membrane protein, KefB/KefC family [uncultured Gammaproteobacteria bacterium]SHN89792.1 Sodium/hydrogen exchanger family protein [Bathymodiolus heckerae thiotrophic gill symbiont]
MNEHLLIQIVLLLAIAVITVSISRRLHFPPILGYIIVGVIVGPNGFGFIEKAENIEALAEFGIVFLLFAIGLEFSIGQMIAMQKQVFGMGAVQVFVTAIVIYLITYLAGLDTNTSIVIASAFALSSTAIVIKQLTEQSEIKSRHGRSALGILIFQDIMVIPLLILIPALAMNGDGGDSISWVLGIAFLKGMFVVVLIHMIGKYLLKPLFHEVASAKSQELFTLTVLTVALSAAAFTEEMGLSMTLGAFLAGTMLSETEYRHQIEADIRPFQDILLGLFFVTIGMSISLEILAQHFLVIILITLAIILIKGGILYVTARLFGKEGGISLRIALSLSQVGEFGLVLLSLAFAFDLLPNETGNILLTAAVLSMSLAPFMIKFNGKIAKFMHKDSYSNNHQEIENTIIEESKYLSGHVILCGFGRVGQTVERFLHKANHAFVVLDMDIKRVHEAQDAGEAVYYGDAAKQSILMAAEINKAKVMIITFSDFHATLKIIKTTRQLNKKLPILVRTLDDSHLNELFEAGATEVIPDTFESSIMLASHLMLMIGQPASKVLRQTRQIRQDRYKILENFYPGEDDNPMEQHQVMKGIIHSVLVEGSMYAIGRRLKDLKLKSYNVKVEAIKRGHVRGENPSEETRIRDNDHIVLSGLVEDIEHAEKYLITG